MGLLASSDIVDLITGSVIRMFGKFSARVIEDFVCNPKLKFPGSWLAWSCGTDLRSTTCTPAVACSENSSLNERSKSRVVLNAQASTLSVTIQ